MSNTSNLSFLFKAAHDPGQPIHCQNDSNAPLHLQIRDNLVDDVQESKKDGRQKERRPKGRKRKSDAKRE